MDDILDSIRRIVSEEDKVDDAPARRGAATDMRDDDGTKGGDAMDTLVLTREMRVDEEPPLNLTTSDEVSEEEREAIASLRMKPADDAERASSVNEDAAAAIAALRLRRAEPEPSGEDEDIEDEVAAFDAALADDEDDDDAPEAVSDGWDDDARDDDADPAADDADTVVRQFAPRAAPHVNTGEPERDAYGFVIPPPEDPRLKARKAHDVDPAPEADEPSLACAFSLRLDRASGETPAQEAAAPRPGAWASDADGDGGENSTEDAAEDTGDWSAMADEAGTADDAESRDFDEAEAGPADASDDRDDPDDGRAYAVVEEADDATPAATRGQIERMVRSAVREELSGALGDKITRNIRGMVRREIMRAMETKQIR